MPRPEGKLNPEQQTFVVQSIACFDPPGVVRDALKKEFGVEVSSQAIEAYDPTKRAGRKSLKKWRELFEATRREFLDDTARIGISHKAVRLRALHRMAERAETAGNLKLAAELHKQAAEEVGGAYTNRREFTGKDGEPLPTAPAAAVTIFALPDNGRS